jgi:hypothetical protein
MQDNETRSQEQSPMALTASPSNIVVPVALEGSVVVPEPLRPEHCELFWEAAKDNLDGIVQWIPYRTESWKDLRQLVDKTLAEQERGESVAFATVERIPNLSSAVHAS